ncbi:uncharacterized protein LOC123305641 [Chrysoperla carnea]|uniref:uncharacterized protein LOC123305641 n=1 Tax=Chrysoperla carnea TaxID=189513 RepID=UPI001D05EC4C|nr:uncharacterized protein LOC123305641 [Chrysoperla carnea]
MFGIDILGIIYGGMIIACGHKVYNDEGSLHSKKVGWTIGSAIIGTSAIGPYILSTIIQTGYAGYLLYLYQQNPRKVPELAFLSVAGVMLLRTVLLTVLSILSIM